MGDLLPAEHLDWDAEAKAEVAAGGEQSSATWLGRAGGAATICMTRCITSHIVAYDHMTSDLLWPCLPMFSIWFRTYITNHNDT